MRVQSESAVLNNNMERHSLPLPELLARASSHPLSSMGIAGARSAVTIGKFAGVHRGHRRLLQEVVSGRLPTVITFDRNPREILGRPPAPTASADLSIMSAAQQDAVFEALGVARCLRLPFTAELAATSAEVFASRLLFDVLGAEKIVVGPGFRFGTGGRGDVSLLRKLGEERGCRVLEVPALVENGERVSSTLVRQHLEQGDVAAASRLLGRYHRLSGPVVVGKRRGRELGFPTANLPENPQGLVPAAGVYAGWLSGSGAGWPAGVECVPAAVSVGLCPTFGDRSYPLAEAYALDVGTDLDLYGAEVAVDFVERIRPMETFSGVDTLRQAIADDVARCRQILAAALPAFVLPAFLSADEEKRNPAEISSGGPLTGEFLVGGRSER